jgi:hypothetical protein
VKNLRLVPAFLRLTRFTDLGFTRDRLHQTPKSAKADLGGEPEVTPDQVRGRLSPESAMRGVHRVETQAEFKRVADEPFEETDLLLAQKFLPTEFDWRVGVLAGEPLFVCQYRLKGVHARLATGYGARGHWQIVKHRADGSAREGGFRTFDLSEAPPELIDIIARHSPRRRA